MIGDWLTTLCPNLVQSMATKKYYTASEGPITWDSTQVYRRGDWAGQFLEAFITDGQCRIGGEPTHDEHVPRWRDIKSLRNKAYFFSSF